MMHTRVYVYRHHHVFVRFFPQISVSFKGFWTGLAYIIFTPTATEALNCLSAYIFWGAYSEKQAREKDLGGGKKNNSLRAKGEGEEEKEEEGGPLSSLSCKQSN